MGMENNSFIKRVGRKIGIGVMAATSFAGGLEASNVSVAEKANVVTAKEFDLKHAKTAEQKLVATQALNLAKAALEDAKEADAKERAATKPKTENSITPEINHQDDEVGFRKNKTTEKVAGQEETVDIIKDGHVVGRKTLIIGTNEWKDYKLKMAKIESKRKPTSQVTIVYGPNGEPVVQGPYANMPLQYHGPDERVRVAPPNGQNGNNGVDKPLTGYGQNQ